MYNKEDRSVANDRFRAVMNQLQKLDRDEEFESSCNKAMALYRNELERRK